MSCPARDGRRQRIGRLRGDAPRPASRSPATMESASLATRTGADGWLAPNHPAPHDAQRIDAHAAQYRPARPPRTRVTFSRNRGQSVCTDLPGASLRS